MPGKTDAQPTKSVPAQATESAACSQECMRSQAITTVQNRCNFSFLGLPSVNTMMFADWACEARSRQEENIDAWPSSTTTNAEIVHNSHLPSGVATGLCQSYPSAGRSPTPWIPLLICTKPSASAGSWTLFPQGRPGMNAHNSESASLPTSWAGAFKILVCSKGRKKKKGGDNGT